MKGKTEQKAVEKKTENKRAEIEVGNKEGK